jgi:hypothetical protein
MLVFSKEDRNVEGPQRIQLDLKRFIDVIECLKIDLIIFRAITSNIT